MQNSSITLMHNRSVAEQIIYKEDGQIFNGFIELHVLPLKKEIKRPKIYN